MEIVIAYLIGVVVGLLIWLAFSASRPRGRKVTVSLVDGTVLTGRTLRTVPGRIRLSEVTAEEGDVPGTVTVFTRNVIAVQVLA